jgi:hypothetical protein
MESGRGRRHPGRHISALLAATPLLLATAAGAAPRVEIEIRNTSTPADDYITWAPALARIRLVPESTQDRLTLVLTNGRPDGNPEPQPEKPHGKLLFARDAGAFKAGLERNEKQDSLRVELYPDGSWTNFVLAGAFGHPSLEDKDAVISVRGEGNQEVARHELMVRIRKDIDKMTAEERRRFLLTITEYRLLNPERMKSYFRSVRVHDLAAKGYDTGEYPDQAHKGAGFLPWHRAFLLQMEREVQELNPAFALPFWRLYQPSPIAFSADFTGANSVATERAQKGAGALITEPELVQLNPGNPLYGWFAPGMGPLMRWTGDRSTPNFSKPAEIVTEKNYSAVSGHIESNPHNVGHVWVGPWMSNCKISPSDPIFWVFHGEFDRLWAAWQQHNGMFLTDGSNPDVFWPNGTYTPGHVQWKGHHLFDTMWPWNGDTNEALSDFGARRPGEAPGGWFPQSPLPGTWPVEPATPRPTDVIDYAGYTDRRNDLGIGFEDVPWSPRQKVSYAFKPGAARTRQKVQPPLQPPATQMSVHEAHGTLRKKDSTEPQLLQALNVLQLQMFMRSIGMDHSHAAIDDPVCGRLRDPAKSVRYAAARTLVTMNAPCVVALMEEQLASYKGDDGQMLFPPASAMGFLLSTRPEVLIQARSSMRGFLKDSRPAVRRMAALALYGDIATLESRLAMALNEREEESVRVGALQGLIRDSSVVTGLALKLAQNEKESMQLRAHAVASLGAWIRDNAVTLPKAKLACLKEAVDKLPRATAGGYPEALATVSDFLSMASKYSVDTTTAAKCEHPSTLSRKE